MAVKKPSSPKLLEEVFTAALEHMVHSPYSYSCFAVKNAGRALSEDGELHMAFYQSALSSHEDHAEVDAEFHAPDFDLDTEELFTTRIIALSLAREPVRDGFTEADFPFFSPSKKKKSRA